MKTEINSWSAMLLMAYTFCLGGRLFSSNKKTRNTLGILMGVFVIGALGLEWWMCGM